MSKWVAFGRGLRGRCVAEIGNRLSVFVRKEKPTPLKNKGNLFHCPLLSGK
jgi:hypothetical protein